MKRYKITVSYDGTNYSGWQIQPDTETVQAVIERSLKTVTGETTRVHGSGRTDTGVHAMGQVAHFDLEQQIRTEALSRSLNAVLPYDIRIIKACGATPDFHARRHAVSKEYRYFIWNATPVPPFLRLYRTHIRCKLDVDAMAKACEYLQGKKNFASFTANSSRMAESTVRNLSLLTVRKKGHELVVCARSEGFLYKMVRSLVGFLIKIGEGALLPEDAYAIIESKTRTAKVPTAPARGLFLWKVFY